MDSPDLGDMDISVKVPPPLQAIFHEQAKSIIAIRELQHEVSSLLQFKNVLLETFPHLHHKIPSLSVLGHDGGRLGGSGHRTVLKTEHPDISDDIPSSWNTVTQPNTGSMPRTRKLRKSPEGSTNSTSTVPDSGFSTEKDISGGQVSGGLGGNLLSPAGGQLRWPQGHERMPTSLPGSPPPPATAPDSDELLGLLDVIHRKAVKLRAQQLVEAEWSQAQTERHKAGRAPLGAIHEHESGASDNIDSQSSDNDTKERTSRRKLFSDGHPDRDHLVDRISELENEALSSNFKVSKLESEISRISRQKELLEEQLRAAISVKSELDSKIHDMHSQYVKSSKKDQSGIIHSVQIVTGGRHTAGGSLQGGDFVLSPSRSETQLTQGSVNIEIRQPGAEAGAGSLSRSTELLFPSGGKGKSVVSLRQRTESTSGPRPSSRFFNRMTGPPNVNKLPPQLNRVLSNDKLSPKSRSVENLYDQRLGLKSSNSEISLQPRGLYLDGPHYKLKTAQSEQFLTKIGRKEKVNLNAVLSSSVASMPAELAKGFRVKPNREKIRQVLGTTSVLELQRQLLTTVMENEVYKTQMSRVGEGWNGKIDEFRKINHDLKNSLSKLKDDNGLLKLQVEEKSIELEGTRARLRQLERTSDGGSGVKKTGIINNKQHQDGGHNPHHDLGHRLGADNYVKFGGQEQRPGPASEPRVTFDLANAKKTKVVEVAPAKLNTAAVVDIAAKRSTALPSDAKKILQEMAYDPKRNYRKSSSGSSGSHLRPSQLNLNGAAGKYTISPPSSPVKLQSPDLTNHNYQTPDVANHKPRVSLSRNNSRTSAGLNSAKNSLQQSNNQNLNNNNRLQKSGKDSMSRHIVTSTPSNMANTNGNVQRNRTPSVERSMPSIKESVDTSKDPGVTQGRQLPAVPQGLGEQGPGLTSLELRHMGRDTIAGLIAGILQKYTKREAAEETVTDGKNAERNNSFVEIALADDDQWTPGPGEAEAGSRPVTALQLRPGAGTSSRLSHKSWEAFNHTEEMTQAITMRQETSVESLTLPDSLNDFEGEEYQSPNLYHDSLGLPQPKLLLGSHHDVDSLQFPASPTPKKVSQSPVDSLIEIGPSKTKINAAEFFDSITSIDKSSKPAAVNFAPKRRIIPYCDNSLSSGTSAFTSQDVSFDSKESSHSPSDSDRTRQVASRGHIPNTLGHDLTIAVHPIKTQPSAQNVPVHPLSRRYQAGASPSQQRIENMSSYIQEPGKPHNELYSSSNSERNVTTEVRNHLETLDSSSGNQTKDNSQQQQLPPKTQSIKTTTEKLKWKFLGW